MSSEAAQKRAREVYERVLAFSGLSYKPELVFEDKFLGSEMNAGVPADASDGSKIIATYKLAEVFTDDELAYVFGHELAHVERQDVAINISRYEDSVKKTAARIKYRMLLAKAKGHGRFRLFMTGITSAATGIKKAFVEMRDERRIHESAADRRGLELAYYAGYDPSAAIGALSKLSGGEVKEYLLKPIAVHPSTPDRIRAIEEELKKYKL